MQGIMITPSVNWNFQFPENLWLSQVANKLTAVIKNAPVDLLDY